MGNREDRGQAFTLEAVTASLLLLGAIVFTVQSAGVTPLTASTSSQQVTGQHEGVAAGPLRAGLENGTVRPTLLYWNETNGTFHGSGEDGYYVRGGPPTAFGSTLNRTYADTGAAFNVNVIYVDEGGEPRRLPIVRQGTPTNDAARVTRTVTLYDDDELRDRSGESTGVTLEEADTFYAPHATSGGPVYNVVRVEVVVWSV